MESHASPGAPEMPAGAAPEANEVPLQPQPFMSKPQLPAGTSASLTGFRYFGFRGATTRFTGPVPRHDPWHSFRCWVAGCAAVECPVAECTVAGREGPDAGDPLASAAAGTASRPVHISNAAATAGIRRPIDSTAFHSVPPRPF